METSRRDARFDNLKGILIFLVVFGHLLELVGGPAAAWLYRLIYSFHMPAFVFCSGWFARFDAARFFRRLLYPYLVYQTLYLLFDRLVLHGDAPLQYTTPYWLLWYLFSMMLWTLLLPLIDGAKSPKAALLACLAAALASGFDLSIGYSMSLSRTLVLLPFFAAGHLAAGGGLRGLLPQLPRRGVIAALSGWIALLFLIVPKQPLPLVAALGQYTLPVFLVHGFFVRSLRLLRPSLPPLAGIGLAILVALLLCAVLGNRFTAALLRPTFCAPQLSRPVPGLQKNVAKRPAR